MSPCWFSPKWSVPTAVRAACSLRGGGHSRAPFDSLNLALHVGDDATAVAANRSLLRRELALPAEPLWLAQVHGMQVVDADALAAAGEAGTASPTADAAVARRPGQVLAIMVADCLPVLLASDDGAVIGAAHAGWRGLAAGVLEATVAAMRIAPQRLSAWFGPAIRQPHFEVGEEVRATFMASDAGAASAFVPNARGRWQCDLPALARRRLHALGVRHIADCNRCTHAEAVDFYSYRRDRRTGRMAALLWLAP